MKYRRCVLSRPERDCFLMKTFVIGSVLAPKRGQKPVSVLRSEHGLVQSVLGGSVSTRGRNHRVLRENTTASTGQPQKANQQARSAVELFARDALSTANESPIIDGYSFRILAVESDQDEGLKHYIVNGKMLSGFAVIASPVKYGDSGIMTFIINLDGVVYQRDLGPDTRKLAASIAEYNPTDNWVPAE